MLGSIFKPRPYPAFVLLAIICGFIGVKLTRASPIAGYMVIAVGVILLISFIRGLMRDEEWRDLRYTFADLSGAQHENAIEIWDDEEAARWKVGDSGKVRYHPDFPEEHRWLE